MAEANDFAAQIEGHDNNPEMLAQAWDGLEADVHDVTAQEKHEAALSLRAAKSEDLAKLEEILTIAKKRTDWDHIDHENEMARDRAEDAEIDAMLAANPVRLSRIKKLTHRVGTLFAPRK